MNIDVIYIGRSCEFFMVLWLSVDKIKGLKMIMKSFLGFVKDYEKRLVGVFFVISLYRLVLLWNWFIELCRRCLNLFILEEFIELVIIFYIK